MVTLIYRTYNRITAAGQRSKRVIIRPGLRPSVRRLGVMSALAMLVCLSMLIAVVGPAWAAEQEPPPPPANEETPLPAAGESGKFAPSRLPDPATVEPAATPEPAKGQETGSGNQILSGGSGDASGFQVSLLNRGNALELIKSDQFTGAGTASIPIDVPPGRGGLQPSVVIGYSSSAGNGEYGYGWNYDPGAIERSTKNGTPKNFSTADQFLLNGEDLVRGAYTGCTETSTLHCYRTRQEAFLKIQGYLNAALTDYDYWVVYDKSGAKYEYGNSGTADGAAEAVGKAGVTRKWGLRQVTDTNGNTYSITYMKDATNSPGALYPDLISYTGGTVDFVWESGRPDVLSSYRDGGLVKTYYRLDRIDVKVGASTLLRKVDFSYTTSSASNRSLLTSVTEYGSDGTTTLPARSFEYSTAAGSGFDAWSISFSPCGNPNGTTIQMMELNGDGLPDVVDASGATPKACINNGNGTFTQNTSWTWGGFTNFPAFVADFDGDGLSEPQGYRNTGSGFIAWTGFNWPGYPSSYTGTYCNSTITGNANSRRLMDLNGDGLVDLVDSFQAIVVSYGCYGNIAYAAYINNGNGTFSSVTGYTGFGPFEVRDVYHGYEPGYGGVSNVAYGDYNGDGLDEVRGFINTGSGFQTGGSEPAYGDHTIVQNCTGIGINFMRRWIDVNGDGILDVVDSHRANDTYYNQIWTYRQAYVAGADGSFMAATNFTFPSGFPDFLYEWRTSTNCTVGASVWSGAIADFNGDGFAEPQGFKNKATKPDLLKKATTGLGGNVSFAYQIWGSSGDKVPMPVPVVSSITTDDGLGGVYTTTYAYAGGYWQPRQSITVSAEFRGFEAVTVTDPAGNKTITHYYQGGGASTNLALNKPVSKSFSMIGAGSLGNIDDGVTGAGSVALGNDVSGNGSLSDWVQIDLGADYTIRRIVYDNTTNGDTTYAEQTGFDFQAATAAAPSTWTTVASRSGLTAAGMFDLSFAAITARYVRVTNIAQTQNGNGTYWRWITDIQIYTSAAGGQEALKGQVNYAVSGGSDLDESNAATFYAKTVYAYATDTTAPFFAPMTQMDSYAYEHTASPKQSQAQYTYDAYGNVLTLSNQGDVAITGDESTTTNEYINDTGVWILGKLKHTYTCGYNNGSQYKSRESWNYYDNAAYGLVGTGANKGNLTKAEAWNSTPAAGCTGVSTPPDTGVKNTFEYDGYGNVIRTKDGRVNAGEYTGYTSQIAYDSTYQTYVASVRDAKDFVTTTGYDSLMRPTSVTDPNSQVTSTEYDVLSRVTKVIKPGDSSASPTVSYTYGLDGAAPEYTLVTAKDGTANGLQSYAYMDGLGRTVQIKSEAQTSGQWTTADTYYDNRGLVQKSSVPYLTTSAGYTARDTAQKNTAYTYDPLGRPTQTTYPDGTTSNASYAPWQATATDALGHQKITLYNAYGQPAQVKEYTGTSPYTLLATTVYTYNTGTGELVKITDQKGNVWTNTYDTLGRKTQSVDPDMGGPTYSWAYTYDANGNLITQTDAKSQVLWFKYDTLNRVLEKRQTNSTGTLLASYTYDDSGAGPYYKGRLWQVGNWGGTRKWGYDARGRTLTETLTVDGKTWTTGYVYDSMDRLTRVTLPDGEQVNNTYNAQGLPATVAGTSTYLSSANYNVFGRIADQTFGNNVKTTYDYYDTSGETDASNGGRAFSYRLKNILTQANGGSGTTLMNLAYQYDAVGNVKSIVDGLDSGKNQTFGYDDLNRLASGSGVYGSKTYTYDAIGNLLTKDGRTYNYYPNDTTPNHRVKCDGSYYYDYDANGNITTRRATTNCSSTAAVDRTYEYNYDNMLTSIKNGTGNVLESYTYDQAGTRVRKEIGYKWVYYVNPYYEEEISSGVGYRIPTANSAETASAGDNNGFQTTPANAYGNDATFAVDTDSGSGASTSCTGTDKDKHRFYNYGFALPAGAVIKGIVVRLDAKVDATTGSPKMCVQLSWDGGTSWTAAKSTAQLTTAEVSYWLGGMWDTWDRTWNTGNTDLTNTNLRVRVINVASDNTRDFSLDWVAVQVYTNTNTLKYYYANGQRIAVRDTAGVLTFIHTDHLGSASKTSNTAGVLVNALWYDPWGTQASGSMAVRYTYTGKEKDATGLYYYGARYYDPVLGRFTTPDSIVPNLYDPQSLNRYAYVRNNPLKMNDPDGHIAMIVTAGIGAVVGAGISYGAQVYGNVSQNGWSASAFTNVDGGKIAAGAVAGAVCGATFGVGTAVLGTGVAATAASGAIAGAASGQAAIATENVWNGQNVTNGLGNPVQMGTDAVIGGATASAGRAIQSAMMGSASDDIVRQTAQSTQNPGSGTTVLGNNPMYVDKAKQLGATYLNTPTDVKWSPGLNTQFLRNVINNGDDIVLANWPPRPGSVFASEVGFMGKNGFMRIGQNLVNTRNGLVSGVISSMTSRSGNTFRDTISGGTITVSDKIAEAIKAQGSMRYK